MTTKKTFTMTTEEYHDGCNNYQGICLNCHEYRDECEPDAENYPCEFCEQNEVMGLEQALIAGHINIKEE